MPTIQTVVLSCVGLLSSLMSTSQKLLIDGSVTYNVSVIAINRPVPAGLEGATLTVLLKPFESRTELKTRVGTETTFYDNRKGKGAILKEFSGQKLMITLNPGNWQHKNHVFSNLRFTPESRDSVISGQYVRSASAILRGGDRMFVFYAPDIRLQNLHYSYALPQLDGLPVLFEIESAGVIFTYILTQLSFDPLPTSKFIIPQNGFRIMTYEETRELNEEKELNKR